MSRSRSVLTLFAAVLTFAGANLLGEEKLRLETPAYPIGAWFGSDMESYSLGRFTAIARRKETQEYAAKRDMFLVASCGWWGMPRDVHKELIANTGIKVSKVGLFLDHNFNYPDFRAWWYERVKQIIQEVDRPEKIFACKIGNEFGYHSWPEVYDYTQWTIDRYHDFLAQEYKSIGELNRRWRSTYQAFKDINPPRDLPTSDMPNWIEWRRFTCWNFAEFFRTSGEHIRQVRKSVPVSDNFYLTSPLTGWDNFELARQTDYFAYDLYDIPEWNRLRFHLDVLRCPAKAYGKPAYLLEYHGGPNHRVTSVTAKDIYVESFLAIARDVRAIMYFRWAPGPSGREQGIHGLCDSSSRPTERTMAAAEFVSECQRLAPHILKSRTDSDVAILYSVTSQFHHFGKTKSDWPPLNRMQEVHQLFALANIHADFIEPRQIDRGELKKYRALVLPGVSVLAASRVKAIKDFVGNGGALIVHAPLPSANELGLDYAPEDVTIAKVTGIQHDSEPAPLSNRTVKNPKTALPENVRAYKSELAGDFATLAETDVPILAVRKLGKGKVIYCPIECLPPGRWPKGPHLRSMADLYAAVVKQETGVLPAGELDAKNVPCDVRRLESGANSLVFVTNLGEAPIPASKLTVQTPPCKAAFLVTAGLREFRRIECRSVDARVEIALPETAVAAVLFLAREAQPVPGLICPERCVPGQTFGVTATLDNLSPVPISGEAALAAPEGWVVKPIKGTTFANVKSFDRAAAAFDVTVPKDAELERWRVRNLIRASFAIKEAGGKGLACEQGIAVLPPVDLRLTYKDEIINPWQELTPPLMRWGFNTDVLTKRHQPVPVAATVPVQLEIIPNLKLGKGEFTLECKGVAIKLDRISVDLSSPSKHIIEMAAAEVGDFELLASCRAGASVCKTTVPIEVTVGAATTEAAAQAAHQRPWMPGQWTARVPISVGNERGSSPGAFVSAKITRDDPAALVDEAGAPVPFAFAEGDITFSCDLPSGKARTFMLYCGGKAEPTKGMSWGRADPRTIKVAAPAYQFEFDSMTGTLRHLRLAGSENDLLVQMDAYATSQDKGRVCKSAFGPSQRFAVSANAAQARIESDGPMGDLKVDQAIVATPGRINVTIKVGNRSSAPVDVAELGYLLQLNGASYRCWARDNSDGNPIAGELPRGFGLSKPLRWQDFHDKNGAGLALLPLSNAMLTSWQEGFQGFRHGHSGTYLVSLRGTTISPKDVIQSDFSLVIHGQPADLAPLGEPSFVVSVGDAQTRKE